MRSIVPALIVSALVAAGCSSPSAAPTPTPAAPTLSETFVGTLKVGGSAFYSFTVNQYGTVNLTLNSLNVDNQASDIQLTLSIGQPGGTDCVVSTSQTTAAGSTPQVTGTFDPGVYCAKLVDIAPLPSPGLFNITIAHP